MNISAKWVKAEIAKLMEQAAGRLSGRSPDDDELSKRLRAMQERLLRFEDPVKRAEQRSKAGLAAVAKRVALGKPHFTKEAMRKGWATMSRKLKENPPKRGPDGHFAKTEP